MNEEHKIHKSDIQGTGYGSSHSWKYIRTHQIPWDRPYTIHDKKSFYECKLCKVTFIHYYDVIPDIFVAIELEKIEDQCPGS